jgi:hypothetical protein
MILQRLPPEPRIGEEPVGGRPHHRLRHHREPIPGGRRDGRWARVQLAVEGRRGARVLRPGRRGAPAGRRRCARAARIRVRCPAAAMPMARFTSARFFNR